MNAKEKIIAYMKAKRLKLFKITGINLYERADYNEIRKVNDKECKEVWEELSKKYDSDVGLCPQCILNDLRCGKCGYGKRHGICTEYEECTYSRIKNKYYSFDIICHPIIDKLNKDVT